MKLLLIIFCLMAFAPVHGQEVVSAETDEMAAEMTEEIMASEEVIKEESPTLSSTTSASLETKSVINNIEEIILDNEEDHFDYFNEQLMTRENNLRQLDLYHLQKAKFKFINGDINAAEFYLNRIDDTKSVVVNIKKRYMSMIYFLRNNFTKSLEMLNHPKVNRPDYFGEICLLKIINYIALNDLHNIQYEVKRCKALTASTSANSQYWLDTIVNTKLLSKTNATLQMNRNLNPIVQSDEIAKLWLKSGLFLNKEEDVASLISTISASAYRSTQIREIIAFTYFRLKQYEKALSFIDDIDSANAENIKGNIRLVNKEYELAFGHFRLALQKKQDSANALERAIPLAWLLGQWEDGINMLSNITDSKIKKSNKDILKIAFLIRKNELLKAQQEIRVLKNQYDNNTPFELEIMDGYVNLILEKDLSSKELRIEKRQVEDSMEKACRAYDGVSCWVSLQYLQWDNFGKTIHRDTPVYTDETLTIDSLKQSVAVVPLLEDNNIDQSDIEELDGKFIKLLPK